MAAAFCGSRAERLGKGLTRPMLFAGKPLAPGPQPEPSENVKRCDFTGRFEILLRSNYPFCMKNDSFHSLKNSFHSSLSLEFHLSPDQIPSFFPLLQKGFTVKARIGVSVQTFLKDHFGLSPEYLRDRVKTIFLDGKTVDDLDKTLILDGSRLALSAALPGLAGAVLRRGSPYAGLRSRVTEKGRNMSGKEEEGFVFLKLFNLLLPELGPVFLRKGILISREDFREFLESLPGDIRKRFEETIRVEGKGLPADQIRGIIGSSSIAWISLAVPSGN